MFWPSLFLVLLIGLLVAAVLLPVSRRKRVGFTAQRAGAALVALLLLTALVGWAGGEWLVKRQPPEWGVAWLSLFALLLAIMVVLSASLTPAIHSTFENVRAEVNAISMGLRALFFAGTLVLAFALVAAYAL
jgi:hypothetical protein